MFVIYPYTNITNNAANALDDFESWAMTDNNERCFVDELRGSDSRSSGTLTDSLSSVAVVAEIPILCELFSFSKAETTLGADSLDLIGISAGSTPQTRASFRSIIMSRPKRSTTVAAMPKTKGPR